MFAPADPLAQQCTTEHEERCKTDYTTECEDHSKEHCKTVHRSFVFRDFILLILSPGTSVRWSTPTSARPSTTRPAPRSTSSSARPSTASSAALSMSRSEIGFFTFIGCYLNMFYSLP